MFSIRRRYLVIFYLSTLLINVSQLVLNNFQSAGITVVTILLQIAMVAAVELKIIQPKD